MLRCCISRHSAGCFDGGSMNEEIVTQTAPKHLFLFFFSFVVSFVAGFVAISRRPCADCQTLFEFISQIVDALLAFDTKENRFIQWEAKTRRKHINLSFSCRHHFFFFHSFIHSFSVDCECPTKTIDWLMLRWKKQKWLEKSNLGSWWWIRTLSFVVVSTTKSRGGGDGVGTSDIFPFSTSINRGGAKSGVSSSSSPPFAWNSIDWRWLQMRMEQNRKNNVNNLLYRLCVGKWNVTRYKMCLRQPKNNDGPFSTWRTCEKTIKWLNATASHQRPYANHWLPMKSERHPGGNGGRRQFFSTQ